MATKICFKCKQEKDLDDFYKHAQMADGHVNKCKDCNLKDVKGNYDVNSSNPIWVEKERSRCREKYKRLDYRQSPSSQKRRGFFWITAEYYNLRRWAKLRINISDMEEIHHWNYNKIKDFFVLDRRVHSRLHGLMIVDETTGVFTTKEGKLLDTKDKHLELIINIIKTMGIKKLNVGIYDFTR